MGSPPPQWCAGGNHEDWGAERAQSLCRQWEFIQYSILWHLQENGPAWPRHDIRKYPSVWVRRRGSQGYQHDKTSSNSEWRSVICDAYYGIYGCRSGVILQRAGWAPLAKGNESSNLHVPFIDEVLNTLWSWLYSGVSVSFKRELQQVGQEIQNTQGVGSNISAVEGAYIEGVNVIYTKIYSNLSCIYVVHEDPLSYT